MVTRSGGQVGELEVKARTGSMKSRCSSRARPASTVKANRHIQPILKVIGTIQVDQNPSKAIKATSPQRQPSSNTSIFHQHLSSLVSYTLRRSPPPYPKTPHHLPNLENTLGLVAEVVISYSWVWRSLRQMVCRNEVILLAGNLKSRAEKTRGLVESQAQAQGGPFGATCSEMIRGRGLRD
jgi:hypothetical protein